MKCPGCGAEISPDSYACPYCGVKKECLACASGLTLGASFCHFCGSNLVVLCPDRNAQKKKRGREREKSVAALADEIELFSDYLIEDEAAEELAGMILDHNVSNDKSETLRLFDRFMTRLINEDPFCTADTIACCADVMRVTEVLNVSEAEELKRKYGRVFSRNHTDT